MEINRFKFFLLPKVIYRLSIFLVCLIYIIFLNQKVFAQSHSNHRLHHSDFNWDQANVDSSNKILNDEKIKYLMQSKTTWFIDKHGTGTWETEIDSRIGKENIWFELNLSLDKEESKKIEYEIESIASFRYLDQSDLKLGVLYQFDPNLDVDRDQLYAVLGIELWPKSKMDIDTYFFSDADKRFFVEFELERDFKFDEKLVLKPYFDADFTVRDQTADAKSSGLNKLQLGLEGRYLITKNIIPFVDLAYAYNKGKPATLWQSESSSKQEWSSDIGIELRF